jgi:hypothetical protein
MSQAKFGYQPNKTVQSWLILPLFIWECICSSFQPQILA